MTISPTEMTPIWRGHMDDAWDRLVNVKAKVVKMAQLANATLVLPENATERLKARAKFLREVRFRRLHELLVTQQVFEVLYEDARARYKNSYTEPQ